MIFSLALKYYIGLRRRIRDVVVRRPWLDQRLGRAMVRVDLMLRKRTPLGRAIERDQVTWRGLTLYSDPPSRNVLASLVTNDDYEPETRAVIEALPSGATFIDLGAHIGLFTLLAARSVGEEGRVYAFEPTPTTRAVLERNISANGLEERITVAPLAVSREPGVATFLVYDQSQGNSIALEGDAPSNAQRLDVEVTSLDVYFAERGWPRVDLIKMDIEGQELNALEGMRELAKRNPGLRLIFEYHRAQIERSKTDARDLFLLLRALGFSRFKVLFREGTWLDLPEEMPRLQTLAARSYLNILCEP